jgi:hypothetical protein
VRRKLRIAAFVIVGLLFATGTVAVLLYQATQQVPVFYRQALAQDSAAATQANDECLQQMTALASDVRRPGAWQAVFTAEQINGWLAVDLVRNYPDLLPDEVHSPRVAITGQQATVACRIVQGESSTVFSLSLDVYVSEPNVLAVRLRGAHAGTLPIPLAKVLEAITAGAHNADLPIEWRQNGGDPVALIALPETHDSGRFGEIDAIELRDGALWIAGHTYESPRGSRPSTESTPPVDRTSPKDDLPLARSPDKRKREMPADLAPADVDAELAVEHAQRESDQVDDAASIETLEAEMKRIDQR